MIDSNELFDRIRQLIVEGEITPTPSNYEFLYRYVTGADPELADAVESARRGAGRLTARAVQHIRYELYGGNGQGTFGRVLEETERQLERMAGYAERSGSDVRNYAQALDDTLGNGGNASLERQRQMLAEMMATTSAMIAKTTQLESELAVSSSEINALKADLEIARSESRTDPLTGLANRKACCDYLEAHVVRARNEMRILSLAFIDIDHFKRFNDQFGHRTGDEVLRLVAQSLERFFHGVGFPARWGGEEFVVVIPGRSAIDSAEIAERFREFISSRTMRTRNATREIGRITLSVGIAEANRDESAQHLIDRADRALYDAKADGRDQVCIAPPRRAAA